MRIFWSFIALLMLGTALLYFVPTLAADREPSAASVAMSDTSEATKTPAASEPQETPSNGRSTVDDAPSVDMKENSVPALEGTLEPSEKTADPLLEENRDAEMSESAEDSTPIATEQAPPPETTSTVDEDSPTPLVEQEGDPDPDPASSEVTASAATDGDTVVEESAEAAVPADPKERFKLQGAGTRDTPYRVTWEMLTSAYESYRPREDKNDIPEWVQELHDNYVRISGYLAYPMLSGEVDEALVMLNAWDGCCLGVPPSPYDSIEVKLAHTVMAERDAFSPFGVVEGKLLVDPYLVNGWLVGLYLMEDASVEMVD